MCGRDTAARLARVAETKARMSMNWLAGLYDEDGTVLIPPKED
jgi:hypothetical protein